MLDLAGQIKSFKQFYRRFVPCGQAPPMLVAFFGPVNLKGERTLEPTVSLLVVNGMNMEAREVIGTWLREKADELEAVGLVLGAEVWAREVPFGEIPPEPTAVGSDPGRRAVLLIHVETLTEQYDHFAYIEEGEDDSRNLGKTWHELSSSFGDYTDLLPKELEVLN